MAWAYWIMIACNVISPQFFWFKSVRKNLTATFVISIFVNIGMWFERFVIIVTSLYRDYLPSSWAEYHPTWIEFGEFLGTFGLFFTLFFLFAKFLPVVNMFEVKTLIHPEHHHPKGDHHSEDPAPTESEPEVIVAGSSNTNH